MKNFWVSLRRAALATILALSALPSATANPLDGHDCFGADVMRRIQGCGELIKRPGIAPSVRAHAFALRALALSIIGRYEKAIEDYDQALAIHPDYAVALNNRAWALYKMGKFNQALPDVERSLELDPTSPHAYDTRAHLRQKHGNAEGAYQDYKRAIRLGGAKMVRLYQCGLQARGHYNGPLSGLMSTSLDNALKACVKSPRCDPLPPDEECRDALS